ncbi:MAG: isoprenylcysteine carboxylmethyltransferase family protein [Terracidiphilus sp.]
MAWDADAVTMLSWEALGIVWLIGLAFTKRTVKAQPDATRVFQMAVILLGYCLLGLGSNWLQSGWLGMRYLPVNFAFREVGAAMTLAGCLFAIWARITLGGNWSGRATVKEGHTLIVKGPYAIARHPIYTGLLLASVGTALAVGQWRCILGLAILVPMFLVKMSQEERLMMETFPAAYPKYRQRVKALIPGVF